ncbi:uncharacterized protein PV09_05505 [Verruconis gallopava]|uniref:Diphthine--ammonia ligase n=1 Tax=Verruconis gallopava TaxID=253628 RepID=A0A0D1YRP0_9PEZI|nr:uncharacterized protein PV09_05505 [Verruconis gallopava]KIW03292.1 hypothetical protein PV09_05505 [Verruconis gallopava]
MTTKLKVIALISGGKDSLFSVLHCLKNGHEVVALANLYPPVLPGGDSIEDIDSFMYQTIGHNIIPLYEDALGIPLFREEITGGAVDTGREYGLVANGDDETEDLVPLLERVKQAVPDANAVSTGAILSTYQRTRVEAIAIRLGLTPLSYLWQYLYLPPYSQTGLLDDMRAVGQDARIVKVASGGLDETFLWQDVTDEFVMAKMRRRMDMYGGGEGGALIGEGGEFETLTLSGPAPLWKKRIEIGHVEKGSGESGISFARLKAAKVVDRDEATQRDAMKELRVPPLLDVEFEQVLRMAADLRHDNGFSPLELSQPAQDGDYWKNANKNGHEARDISPGGDYLQLANLMASPYGSAPEQMAGIVDQLMDKLKALGLDPSHITHSTILLRSMSTFAAINPIYGSMFAKPTPPSRVTISCGELMPPGVDIVLSTLVQTNKQNDQRHGLHVQSRSYWAPANIGPYSQAISVPFGPTLADSEVDATGRPRIVHVAGQIPLVPASMETVTAEQMPWERSLEPKRESLKRFIAQSVLSLQHLWRIGRAMEVVAWTGAVAFISRCSLEEAASRAALTCNTWLRIHDIIRNKAVAREKQDVDTEDVEYDIWDLKNNVAPVSTSRSDGRDLMPALPDIAKIASGHMHAVTDPPVFAVQVEELPRSVDIEWCGTGIASASNIGYSSRVLRGASEHSAFVDFSADSRAQFTYLAFDTIEGVKDLTRETLGKANKSMTMFAAKPVPEGFVGMSDVPFIPCFSIHGRAGAELKSFEALVIMRQDSSNKEE